MIFISPSRTDVDSSDTYKAYKKYYYTRTTGFSGSMINLELKEIVQEIRLCLWAVELT